MNNPYSNKLCKTHRKQIKIEPKREPNSIKRHATMEGFSMPKWNQQRTQNNSNEGKRDRKRAKEPSKTVPAELARKSDEKGGTRR